MINNFIQIARRRAGDYAEVTPAQSMRSQASMAEFLSSYPRNRPPLSINHRRVYLDHYKENREGTGILTRCKIKAEGWMHRRIAARQYGNDILEIGAGTLNHLVYEPDHLIYDAVEPFRDLWESQSQRQRLRDIYKELEDIPAGRRYDRVISIAVLEHLTELPRIMAAAALRLRPGGRFQAGIPSEGGFLWGAAWRLTTGVKFRLGTGLSYADIMRHEHVNDAPEIMWLARWLFARVETERFPFLGHHVSFYTVFEAHEPRVRRCEEVLERHG